MGPQAPHLGVQFSLCHLPGIHGSVILNSARYFSPRGLDGEDRRLWFGHGESSVERLQTGGTAQWIHPVDGKHCSTSEGPCFCVGVNQGRLIIPPEGPRGVLELGGKLTPLNEDQRLTNIPA